MLSCHPSEDAADEALGGEYRAFGGRLETRGRMSPALVGGFSVPYLSQGSDRPQVQASVAVAVAVDSVFVCVEARGHVGRSQQQLLQLPRKRTGQVSQIAAQR